MSDRPIGPPVAPPGGAGLQAGGASYPTSPPERWPDHAPPPAPYGGSPDPGPVAPPGGDRPSRGGPVVLTAVAVVAVLALVIAGVGTLVSSTDDDGDEATDTTVDLSDPGITAPPSEEPIDPNMPTMPSIPGLDPGSGVDPAERARPLEDVLPELIEFVETTRGQEFATEPVVEAVAEAEFDDLLAAERAEETAEAEARGDGPEALAVAGTALGLLPPGFDAESATADLEASFVFGFYDPDTAELYVEGEQVTPFVQSVVVHELTHALDDQIFDLGRLDDLVTRDDETAFGFLSLVEGTASHVQAAFEAQLSPEDTEALEAEQFRIGLEQLPSAMGLPAVLLVESQVPYTSGERFVDDLVTAGGMAEVDTAYGEPPTTGEQILDPDVYLDGEGSVPLRPLEAPAGAEVADEGAFGAVDLRLLGLASDPLGALVDPDVGMVEPVPGYGGGQFVSWTEGGRSCIALEAVGDDADGSAAIEDALQEWAGFVPGAEVSSRPGGGGLEVVTATSCV